MVASAADPADVRAPTPGLPDGTTSASSAPATSPSPYDVAAERGRQPGARPCRSSPLDADGSPRHYDTCHPRLADDIPERGIDLLSPVWNLLDLTPAGRGDWYAGLDY